MYTFFPNLHFVFSSPTFRCVSWSKTPPNRNGVAGKRCHGSIRAYLIQTGLMEGLATAGVIAHLIRDGGFKAIGVADAALHAEALRSEDRLQIPRQLVHANLAFGWKYTHTHTHHTLSLLTTHTHTVAMKTPVLPWRHPLRARVAGKKTEKNQTNQHLVNATFFVLLWMLMKLKH